ncbi:MAG: CidA/LrgA family protein, partial [Methylobacterium sp.]
FVPAGAGIVGRLDVVQAQGLRLAIVVVVSTVAALVATVLVFLWVARLTARIGGDR